MKTVFAAALAAGVPAIAQQRSQADLAKASEAELAAAAKARSDNPNKPTQWWPEMASKQGDSWYLTPQAKTIAANILSWQDKKAGGWPLMNTTREPFTGDVSKAGPWGANASMIKATVNEIRFMARAWRATKDERYRKSALDGINFILKAQYPSGGWPHSWPVRDDYTRWATYNDDMMPDLMRLLDEVATGQDFAGFDPAVKRQAKAAFDRGIDFILKTQVKVDGKPTVWCQQHDPVTYECRAARNFEPAAITGGESASVLSLLMGIKRPSPQVKAAIDGGIAWYRKAQINGIKVTVGNGDRVVTPDPSAPPVWARYYETKTGRPIFVGRDAIVRYNLAEVEKERRGGYSWYNQNGSSLFRQYDQWKAANG